MSEEYEEHEITCIPGEPFYFVSCPYCNCEFAVWEFVKPNPFGYGLADKEDMPKIYCPLCGEQFPLVIEKAPKVMLSEWPEEFEEGVES